MIIFAINATDKHREAHSPFAKRKENHCKVISCTLPFVIWPSSNEVIGAISEVQLSEIDGETRNKADPKSNPQ